MLWSVQQIVKAKADNRGGWQWMAMIQQQPSGLDRMHESSKQQWAVFGKNVVLLGLCGLVVP